MQKQTPRVDLGLAISGALLPPGKCRSQSELAHWCDCSRQAIAQIEKNALRKLRFLGKFEHLRDAIAPNTSAR